MSQLPNVNVLLAVEEEHTDRTGHDPHKSHLTPCSVCMFIRAAWEEVRSAAERAERATVEKEDER